MQNNFPYEDLLHCYVFIARFDVPGIAARAVLQQCFAYLHCPLPSCVELLL